MVESAREVCGSLRVEERIQTICGGKAVFQGMEAAWKEVLGARGEGEK